MPQHFDDDECIQLIHILDEEKQVNNVTSSSGTSGMGRKERLCWLFLVIFTALLSNLVRIDQTYSSSSTLPITIAAEEESAKILSWQEKQDFLDQVTVDDLFDRYGLAGKYDDDAEELMEVVHKFHTDGEPVPILGYDYLFVGSAGAAYNFHSLQNLGVTSIINAAGLSVPNKYKHAFKYKKIRVEDSGRPKDDISQFWNQTSPFIDKTRKKGGKVLVHCWGGGSRSVSVLMAYLIEYHHLTVDQALTLVKKTRARAHPNQAYMERLHDLQSKLFNNTNVLP